MAVAGFIAKAPKKMHRRALHPGWVGVANLSLRQVPNTNRLCNFWPGPWVTPSWGLTFLATAMRFS